MDPSPTNRSERVFNITLIGIVIIFITMWILGIRGPVFIANDRCYALFGCNVGFFGYDAVLHFVSGVMDVLLLVWLMRKFPVVSLFQDRFWKNLLVVVALVALIAVSWEFGEFCNDHFRVEILHEDLIATNHLDQPTNADTMGDMTFSIIGGAITACALGSFMKKKGS